MNFLSQIRRKMIFCFILALTIIISSFIYITEANEATFNRFYSVKLDNETIKKGYTVNAFDNILKLSLTSDVLSEPTEVEIIELNEAIDLPWQLEKISQVYQFEFKNKLAYNKLKPFYIQFSYNKPSNYYKQVFYYDKRLSVWQPLPTIDFPDKSFVRSLIHLPFARLAIFANPDVLVIGQTSWYKYKDGLFTASPDFPKKSKLRVYNTDNNKYVDVVVNDFGPDRKIYSNRVIDLDKVAFQKLAPTRAGVINIRVEPIYIASKNNENFGILLNKAAFEIAVSAKSAIVMDERTNKILWQKNANLVLPLASLTKLVAIKIFLDLRPTLSQVVAYSIKDEEYNYQYCNKWEPAKVNLCDGETITIEDLIYSSLVGSANNTIETLIRISGLSRDEFIAKMNQTVTDWGATSTHFIEATGLSPQNVSSALDYAIITKEVYIHPIIKKASTMAVYNFKTINSHKAHRIKNTNQLIKTSSLEIVGSKTGYLDEALYCLMLRAKKNSTGPVIVVTMGAKDRMISFQETEALAKYGLKKISQKFND
ncbi:MAG: RlpA-like double-psi beta-barrel domain-containing protein [Patescibacteria group bacterium]|nr:hypothetical protein [Patescibacteria group bacterium]